MKLLIDDANIENIKRLYEKYPIVGVTSNPTILKRAGRPPLEVLKEIRAFIPKEHLLHAQVISTKAEEMVKEADAILSLGENVFVKIPAKDEGFKAIKLLKAKGIDNITVTAIYSPAQALMAAIAGARWVAPYINRIDNLGADGVEVARKIQMMFNQYDFNCGVIGASFKNTNQILELALAGCEAMTAAPEVIESMVNSAITDKAVVDFTDDFENLCGKGQTFLTLK